jgi:hypothetical protein
MRPLAVDESFEPSGRRGELADDRMHIELASSLEHLASATKQADQKLSDGLIALAFAIGNGQKLKPLAFRSYYLLVQDLVGQDLESAGKRLLSMEGLSRCSDALSVTYFGHPDADSLSLELISDGMRLAPISDIEGQNFSKLLGEGLALMKEVIPDLFEEISGIVKEVLLARAPRDDEMEFDGASHYQFWGLLMLNPRHHKTPLEVVEVLAHEASHSLLFGLTIDEPLVLNSDDELFSSPLRIDKRPMDGIYHATYVSARMCWAMEKLAGSGLLSSDDRKSACKAAALDRQNYTKGLSVVDAHGRLSDTGTRILNGARNWISSQK